MGTCVHELVYYTHVGLPFFLDVLSHSKWCGGTLQEEEVPVSRATETAQESCRGQRRR